MTYRLSLDTYFGRFQRTDDTLIVEDFHMTYGPCSAAQKRAANYLQHVMKEFQRIFLSSRSTQGKSQNLCLLVSYLIPLFERVDATYASVLLASTSRYQVECYQRTSLTFDLCPSRIHRYDVGSSRTDDHLSITPLAACPSTTPLPGSQGRYSLTVSETSQIASRPV